MVASSLPTPFASKLLTQPGGVHNGQKKHYAKFRMAKYIAKPRQNLPIENNLKRLV